MQTFKWYLGSSLFCRQSILVVFVVLGICPAEPIASQVSGNVAELLPSDGTQDDWFGRAVAISGDTIVAGAGQDDDNGLDSSSAYVFLKPAGGRDGVVSEAAKLLPSEAATRFGDIAVDIDGDTIIVDAWASDYVFVKPPEGWTPGVHFESAVLRASDAPTEDSFGRYSLAVSGDTIVVGRREASDNGLFSGKAYVFVKPAGGWSGQLNEDARLLPSDGSANDFFGNVAIDSDLIVVGASLSDAQGEDSGAAYVFERPVAGWSGTLLEDARLAQSPGSAGDKFGFAIDIRGNTVVVGGYEAGGTGAAYVFETPAGGWSGTANNVAKLLASDGAAGDSFGQSVAISGNNIAVGAPQDADFGTATRAAYYFTRPAGGWTGTLFAMEKLRASDGARGDYLGANVSTSGEVVVAGARWHDDNGLQSGAAFVFLAPQIFGDGFELGDTSAWSATVN